MEVLDRFRCLHRAVAAHISYRKLMIIGFFALAFLLYLGPSIYRFLSSPKARLKDPVGQCVSDRVVLFIDEANKYDANIRHFPLEEFENPLLAFVGNGKIGITIEPDGKLYLKSGRVLSVPVPFHPIVTFSLENTQSKEATVVHYTSGVAHKFVCFHKVGGSVDIHYVHYAHRTMPSLYIQEIKITNPSDEDAYFDVDMPGISDWEGLESASASLDIGGKKDTFPMITGKIAIPESVGQFFAFSVIYSKVPKSLHIKRQSTDLLLFVTSVHYVGPVTTGEFKDAIDEAVRQAKVNFSRALKTNPKVLKEEHKKVWLQHWSSGFSISDSKASNALNGDVINATIYYIMSNTRSPLNEVDIIPARRQELQQLLASPDRCYDGHHTLQASTLWSHLETIEDVINVVSLWKLTLEKQGCYTMLKAGADGVLQAILLSFGSLKFNNHHLEFCTHPKDLHRDYHFRRLSYGNGTHVNISVQVGEDNKASLLVALDRSDKNYYACDGGCLDNPVELGTLKKQFPVKLTDPPTAILYITANKQHMEELKHTIHVKEVVEAPAHEHHIIALHRHGHHLGGLPTLFWVSIAFLVLVFHLFLFKLIYNEYCTNNNQQEKARARYAL